MRSRPTIYKGVRMRSRLEARFAARLDQVVARHPELFADTKWEYEPVCFAGEDGQYLPDFALATADGTRVYVEVKPFVGESDWPIFTRRMEIIWESEPDAVLTLCEFDGECRRWAGVLTDGGPWWVLQS